MAEERICKFPRCGTRLAELHKGDYCYRHEELGKEIDKLEKALEEIEDGAAKLLDTKFDDISMRELLDWLGTIGKAGKELYTIKETADILCLSPRRTRELVQEGYISALRLGRDKGKILIPKEEIEHVKQEGLRPREQREAVQERGIGQITQMLQWQAEPVSAEECEDHQRFVIRLLKQFLSELHLPDWRMVYPDPTSFRQLGPHWIQLRLLALLEGPLYKCVKLSDNKLILCCPTEFEVGFRWLMEHFDNYELWETYDRWQKIGGYLITLQPFDFEFDNLGQLNEDFSDCKEEMDVVTEKIIGKVKDMIEEAGDRLPGGCIWCRNPIKITFRVSTSQ
jgi:excisionase family DNA binding protein